jgi:hypothetical protein
MYFTAQILTYEFGKNSIHIMIFSLQIQAEYYHDKKTFSKSSLQAASPTPRLALAKYLLGARLIRGLWSRKSSSMKLFLRLRRVRNNIIIDEIVSAIKKGEKVIRERWSRNGDQFSLPFSENVSPDTERG